MKTGVATTLSSKPPTAASYKRRAPRPAQGGKKGLALFQNMDNLNLEDVKNIAENADNLIKIITNIKEQVGNSGSAPA